MPVPPHRRAVLFAALLSAAAAAPRAQDPTSAIETEEGEAPSHVYKPLGPVIFPFYVHELRTSDQTEFQGILLLFWRASRPDGSGWTLLLPFFYHQHLLSPPDDRFYFFPFYYHRRSEEVSLDYLIPFFFHHQSGDSSFQLLLPFWWHIDKEAGRLSEHHFLFPLARFTSDERIEERPVESFRLGLWKLLELYESRTTRETIDRRGLNLLNWGEVAQSGLSIYRSSWVTEREVEQGAVRLFPFYWYGYSPGSSYFWLFPLFGYWKRPAQEDYFFPPLLARFGSGDQESIRLDLLFPLLHFSKSTEELSIASYPLFDYYHDPTRSRLGVLFWLYRTYHDVQAGGRTHLVLFPLGYFHDSRDGVEGTRWLFPWLDTFNKERRYRILLPLFLKRESLAGGEVESYFTLALPSYISWGEPQSYFAMGFPLYWASRDGARGWELLLPLFWRSYTASTSRFFSLPFSYRSLPAERQLWFLGPLYVHRRLLDLEERPSGSSHSILWPLTSIENRQDGYHYRFFPFFWVGKDNDSSDLLLTPFYYHQTTPAGSFRYFFPFYARHEGRHQTREFYAAGAYMQSRQAGEDGAPLRSSVDLFWWLASFQRDHQAGWSHEHILPLGYWRTASLLEKRMIAAPFYYSHRLVEQDEVHSLDLFLGNLFFSKVVEGPPAAAAGACAAGEGPAAALEPPRPERWRDQGLLWPLSRWYRDDQGQSGAWAIPFFFNIRSDSHSTLALFPFFYSKRDEGTYDPSYFRYFFLLDSESAANGSRLSIGQLLFDWWREDALALNRFRLLYPLFELTTSKQSFGFRLTPLVGGESASEGGDRRHSYRAIPFFWKGGHERLSAGGEWQVQERHFFLFPLYGFHGRSTREDYHILYPLIHLQRSPGSLSLELWPLIFYRSNPALRALRLWPFHASESGETAGDFWVSRFLFLSKHFRREQRSEYRLDPFLFRLKRTSDEFGIGGPLELLAYDRSPQSTSYRAIPFLFGHADTTSAATALIPFHYREDFGEGRIDYWRPWRFLFLTSSLRGGGERHFSILTKLFDNTSAERPEFHETRVLHRLFFDYRTENSRQLEVNPFFRYYRDDAEERTALSLLFSLYRQETLRGRTERTVFYFIRF